MNRHAAVELDFADGTFTFRLGLGEIEELEAKRDLSLFAIARRLHPDRRDSRLADLSEVLRLGLIGGGMSPIDALAKVRRYVDERPIDESRDIAYAVVLAGLSRVRSKEIEAESGEADAAKTNGSTSPRSAETPS
jgi:hypothetical protein